MEIIFTEKQFVYAPIACLNSIAKICKLVHTMKILQNIVFFRSLQP